MERIDVMSTSQRDLLTRIVQALSEDGRVRAAWLGGSFARGNADAYSDLDVLVVVEDAALSAVVAGLDALWSRIGLLVFHRFLPGSRERVVVAVTDDWQRFDLSILPRSELGTRSFPHVLSLFDRDQVIPSLHRAVTPADSNATLRRTIEEFIRVLGLLPVVLRRGEYLVAVDGVGRLRRLLIDLFLVANDVTDRGGALRLNPYLTPAQRAMLERFPPLAANREAVIEGHLAGARTFLPLARALSVARGVEYPTAFERATAQHLLRALGVSLD